MNKWIPVAEMPEGWDVGAGVECILGKKGEWSAFGGFASADYYGVEGEWVAQIYVLGGWERVYPTHWQPLPEPPEDDR